MRKCFNHTRVHDISKGFWALFKHTVILGRCLLHARHLLGFRGARCRFVVAYFELSIRFVWCHMGPPWRILRSMHIRVLILRSMHTILRSMHTILRSMHMQNLCKFFRFLFSFLCIRVKCGYFFALCVSFSIFY